MNSVNQIIKLLEKTVGYNERNYDYIVNLNKGEVKLYNRGIGTLFFDVDLASHISEFYTAYMKWNDVDNRIELIIKERE